MDFPTILDDCGNEVTPTLVFDETSEHDTIVSETNSGFKISKPRYSRTLKSFRVVYNYVKNSVYIEVDDFFNNSTIGKALFFNWTHPITNVVYVVRFNQDKLQRRVIKNSKLSSFEFKLLEV